MSDGETWDAIVVGAGPAGGCCAALLAARGWRTLLVERSPWPRDKVCGGCLNGHAVAALRGMGLSDALATAVPVTRTLLRTPGRAVTLATPGGVAIARRDLDAGLVEQFQRRGGTFLPGVAAHLLPTGSDFKPDEPPLPPVGQTFLPVSPPGFSLEDGGRTGGETGRNACPTDDQPDEAFRSVAIRCGDGEIVVRGRVVLACDGIGGTLLKDEPAMAWDVNDDAWVGLSATFDAAAGVDVDAGAIHMHLADGGYVGVVRMAGGVVHLAAALSPELCRERGGPRAVVADILRRCGGPHLPVLNEAKMKGTGPLTRRRRALGGHRVLAVGDACGYVEPFTGEGMAWAIRSAADVVPLLPQPGGDWPAMLERRWANHHRATIGRQHWRCRAIRFGLHRPRLAGAAAVALAACPALAGWAMR